MPSNKRLHPTRFASAGTSQRGGSAALVRLTDGAWEKSGGGLPHSFDRLPLLASDPVASGHLYLASGHGVVWHSSDGGDAWHQLPIHLRDVWFRLIAS